jgi:formylglycine-generating enzyme required for sulfatase activity
MDRGEKIWPLLKHSPDPTLRSFLIERLGPGGVDARILWARLEIEKDTSIRRALLLSLGEYGPDRLLPAERQNLLPGLLDLYRNDPDPGIHGAAKWLLKKWEAAEKIKEIDEASRVASASRMKRGWSVNSQGQTMVVIPKPREGAIWVGEGGMSHKQPMGHNFDFSSEDVTVEQFQRFRAEYKPDSAFAHTKECTAIKVSWFDAAAYCNWLSQREGIVAAQWCYEPNEDGKYARGMKIKAGYLRLQGYRLPTEAEWEYACRAGSQAGYSFGESEELLERYGWFIRNSLGRPYPVALLKPNDLGLFDMHGNVWQWTHDSYDEKTFDRGESVDLDSSRVLRGGGWAAGAEACRAGHRSGQPPLFQFDSIGFRLARVPVEGK